jgi:hypothetical protein
MRQFIIVHRPATEEHQAVWVVTHGRKVHGGYCSEWAALLNAIDAAREKIEKSKRRLPAEVVVQRNGTHELRWRSAPPETARPARRRRTG